MSLQFISFSCHLVDAVNYQPPELLKHSPYATKYSWATDGCKYIISSFILENIFSLLLITSSLRYLVACGNSTGTAWDVPVVACLLDIPFNFVCIHQGTLLRSRKAICGLRCWEDKLQFYTKNLFHVIREKKIIFIKLFKENLWRLLTHFSSINIHPTVS